MPNEYPAAYHAEDNFKICYYGKSKKNGKGVIDTLCLYHNCCYSDYREELYKYFKGHPRKQLRLQKEYQDIFQKLELAFMPSQSPWKLCSVPGKGLGVFASPTIKSKELPSNNFKGPLIKFLIGASSKKDFSKNAGHSRVDVGKVKKSRGRPPKRKTPSVSQDVAESASSPSTTTTRNLLGPHACKSCAHFRIREKQYFRRRKTYFFY